MVSNDPTMGESINQSLSFIEEEEEEFGNKRKKRSENIQAINHSGIVEED